MGLISFVKNAGAKLFSKRKSSDAQEAELKQSELDAQKAVEIEGLIRALGLEINDLYVEVSDDVATLYGNSSVISEKEKAVLAAGNIAGIAQVDDRIEYIENRSVSQDDASGNSYIGESTYYTVVKGDTLGRIAKDFYGNAMKYPVIFEANRPMLKDPNLIYPGQVLRIPPLA